MSDLAFITIGQTPRIDLVPDLLALMPKGVDAFEYGLLDGLSEREIYEMRPIGSEDVLVSRLVGGKEVSLSIRRSEERLDKLLKEVDRKNYDGIILLCTGWVSNSLISTPIISPREINKQFFSNFSGGLNNLGVITPSKRQESQFVYDELEGINISFASASPYVDGELHKAGEKLKHVEMIFMHCMGYSEQMRMKVEETSGRPVVLARNIFGAEAARHLEI